MVASEMFLTGAISVALPNIAGSFGASPDEISWVVTLYLAGFTVILPLTAWLSNFWGQRTYLCASLVVYMLASAGCALSHSLAMLLTMRTLQGMAGAAFLVRSMFIYTTQFPPAVKKKANLFFIVGLCFKTTAAPVGGFFADNLSWRWLFLLPVPLMGLGALLPMAFSAEVWPRRRNTKLDLFGPALLAVGLGALFVILYRGQKDGWFDSHRIRFLAMCSLLLLPLFIWHQCRPNQAHRLLTLESLRHPGVAVGLLYGFLIGNMIFGGLYLLPQSLRAISKHDSFGTGMLTGLDSLGTLVGLLVCGVGLDFCRTRAWLCSAGLLFTASMALFALRQTSATPDEMLYLPLILRGLSIGFLLPAAAQFIFRRIAAANHALTTEARGMYYTTRYLGGAIAVAAIVAMLDVRQTLHSTQLTAHLTAGNLMFSRTLAMLGAGTVRHGMNPALSSTAGQMLLDRMVAREATVLAFQDVFWLLAAVGLVASGLALLFPRLRNSVKKNGSQSSEVKK
jgi:DHA2 family multidrug resistance protein